MNSDSSAKKPMTSGITAPPTMAMMSNPEPSPVKGPSSPAMPSVKMLGNITELNSPTRMMLHIARCPKLRIDMHTSNDATIAAKPNTVPVRSFCRIAGSNEPSHHRAQPVQRHVPGGHQLRDVANIGLVEIVDEETSDRHFRAHVYKDTHHAQHEVRALPETSHRECALPVLFGTRHGRQLEHRDRSAQAIGQTRSAGKAASPTTLLEAGKPAMHPATTVARPPWPWALH